jgi:hypothetical protein
MLLALAQQLIHRLAKVTSRLLADAQVKVHLSGPPFVHAQGLHIEVRLQFWPI